MAKRKDRLPTIEEVSGCLGDCGGRQARRQHLEELRADRVEVTDEDRARKLFESLQRADPCEKYRSISECSASYRRVSLIGCDHQHDAVRALIRAVRADERAKGEQDPQVQTAAATVELLRQTQRERDELDRELASVKAELGYNPDTDEYAPDVARRLRDTAHAAGVREGLTRAATYLREQEYQKRGTRYTADAVALERLAQEK